jgi:RNA polymerase sigma factor (sigma-70 family)
MDPRYPGQTVMVVVASNPCDADDAPRPRAPDHPEYAQASTLSDARAALAVAILAEPEGLVACRRVIEAGVHRGRVSRRALLLERPAPRWVQDDIDAVHEEAGCWRQPVRGPAEPKPGLAGTMARLPWSGEWLVRVWSTLPGPAAARVRPVAEAWIAGRNAFVEGHRRLVASIARRYLGRAGLSQDDLIQEGLLALCRAVERYDPGRGTRFSSYAVPALQRGMAHAIRQSGYPPAAPQQLSRTSVAACPLRTRGPATAGRIRSRPPALVSLDAAVDGPDESGMLTERLADPNVILPDVSAVRRIEHDRLRAAFEALPSDAQHVLTLHWGLDDGAARSVHQIGRLLGRREEEIDAIIARSRRRLRERLTGAQRPPSNCADIPAPDHQITSQYLTWRAPVLANGDRPSSVRS